MKTIAQLKDGVAGLLAGVDLDTTTDLNNAIERAARILSQKIYIPEQMNPYFFTLYDRVTNYGAPSDIFGNMFVDIQPIGNSRSFINTVSRVPVEVFDRTKCYFNSGYEVTFEYAAGIPTMRIAQNIINKSILLDSMNEVGNWVVGGTASGLVEDDVVYYQAPASLRFNLNGAGTGSIVETLTTPNDLTSYVGVGVAFLALDTPFASLLTSIELRLGSDASNYYTVTATTGFLGAWQSNNFILVAFDQSLATKVGNPTITAMDYQALFFTTSGTINNMRVGELFLALGSPHKLLYQTDAIFIARATGVISQSITNDQDTIALNDSAYNLFEHEAALAIGGQNGGSLASPRLQRIDALLNGSRTRTGTVVSLGLYDLYRGANPSEEIKTVGNWYFD